MLLPSIRSAGRRSQVAKAGVCKTPISGSIPLAAFPPPSPRLPCPLRACLIRRRFSQYQGWRTLFRPHWETLMIEIKQKATGKVLHQVHGDSLEDVDLAGVDLFWADLRGADLTHSNLDGVDLGYALLEGTLLGYTCLRGANLCGANMRGAVLSRAELPGANLRGADLREAVLLDADLTGADLTGADLTMADLSGALLGGVRVDETTRGLDQAPDLHLPHEQFVEYRK